jgi:hypothetical protein
MTALIKGRLPWIAALVLAWSLPEPPVCRPSAA